MARLKILVAGDPASIHANRFVNLLQEIGYDIRVFHSEHYYTQEEHLHDTLVYVSNFEHPSASGAPERGNTLIAGYPEGLSYDSFARRIFHRYRRIWVRGSGRLSRRKPLPYPIESPKPRAWHLASVIRSWRPDVVFSLKMQNDAYTVAEAHALLGAKSRPRWVHFSWGTDFEYFGKHPDHAPAHVPRIRDAMDRADFLITDCQRDMRQARAFGFRGEHLATFIAPGGFDLDEIARIRTEAGARRDVILVKGREGGYVGRAMNVMQALAMLGEHLRGYKVRVIMATAAVHVAAKGLARSGVDCEVMERLPYGDLLRLFARSRVALSASDVDGSPVFLMEAMALGAFPVHSDMESVREWIVPGENGLLFPVDDIDAIGRCLELALRDDRLVESARFANQRIAAQRMDRSAIRAQVRNLIERRVLAPPHYE